MPRLFGARPSALLAAGLVATCLLAGSGVAHAQRSFDARALSQSGRRTTVTRGVRTQGASGARGGNVLGRPALPSVRSARTSARSTSANSSRARGAVIGYRLANARTTDARAARVPASFWPRVRSAVASVRSQLTDELRRAPWRGSANPMAGHCYVASEALYHMLGGREAGWVPKVMSHEGATHWFLEHRPTGRIVDPTADQFRERPIYESARGAGFLTLAPSARTRTVMERVASR